jgi:hypothetical protein
MRPVSRSMPVPGKLKDRRVACACRQPDADEQYQVPEPPAAGQPDHPSSLVPRQIAFFARRRRQYRNVRHDLQHAVLLGMVQGGDKDVAAPVDCRRQMLERHGAGIDAKRPVVYAPAQWALIMFVMRNLPRFIFNRLDF